MLDRNFTKFILLTPGTQQLRLAARRVSENPQGSTQTMVNGQHFSGTGYQLDGTENRDPILGIIVINPTLESIGETQDHLAELRRRVRPGDGRRRLGADQVGHQRLPRQRVRVLSERQVPGAEPVHAGAAQSAHRQVHPGHDEEPVRRLDRRADHEEQVVLLRRLPGHAQHAGRLAAADRADRAARARRPQRVRRQHLRSRRAATPASARSSPAT